MWIFDEVSIIYRLITRYRTRTRFCITPNIAQSRPLFHLPLLASDDILTRLIGAGILNFARGRFSRCNKFRLLLHTITCLLDGFLFHGDIHAEHYIVGN